MIDGGEGRRDGAPSGDAPDPTASDRGADAGEQSVAQADGPDGQPTQGSETPSESTESLSGAEPAPAAESGPEAAPASEPATRGFELYLLRHADAGDPAEWAGDDADRPLSKKGRRQAKALGDYLKSIKVRPGAVITSPKVRAADTARTVAKRLGAAVTVDRRLAGEFESDALGELLRGVDPGVSSAVLVGHDPDFSMLLSWLVGAPLSLRKGAIARADLPDRSVGPGRGTLRWLLPPDAVPG